MKRTAIDHPKTKRLMRQLDVSLYSAVGILELLWQFTARHSIHGNVGKWPDREIATAIGWPEDDAERLINALVDSRLLDRDDHHRLIVHDWPEHCEDNVHKTLARRLEFFANREIPKLTRLGKDERQRIGDEFERLRASQELPNGAGERPRTPVDAQERPRTPTDAQERSAIAKPSQAIAKPSHSQAKPEPRGCGGGSENGDELTFDWLMARWNQIAGVCHCRSATAKRRQALATRLKSASWRRDLPDALVRIERSGFCQGKGNRGWQANIDWLLKPDTVTRVLEGNFDDDRQQQNSNGRRIADDL